MNFPLKLVALIALPLVVIGAGLTYAHQGGEGQHGHGHGHGHRMEMHLDHMNAMLTKIGASDAQKTQIDGILRGAFSELKAVHDGHDAALGKVHEILFAPSVDRRQIESLRADQIRAFDTASRLVTTAFGDAAEVLSPEQRAALAAEVRKHHGD